MEERPTLSTRVTNIPHSAITQELFNFLESLIGKGEIFAIEISTEHKNWKSRGHGRVQFDSPESKIKALSLSHQRKLFFRGSHLTLSHSFDDIIIRPVDPNNRVENAEWFVSLAGIMSMRDCMGILESWDEVKLWVLPEKRKLEFFVKYNGECYKLEVGFGDVLETQGCCLGGNKQNVDAILLRSGSGRCHGPDTRADGEVMADPVGVCALERGRVADDRVSGEEEVELYGGGPRTRA